MTSRMYWWDEATMKFVEHPPESKIRKFGKAPYVIQDTIEGYYHPAAEKWVESRSQLKALDEAHNTITTDKKIAPDPSRQKAERAKRRKDIQEATRKAVAAVDSGNAPLDEKTKKICEERNHMLQQRLGMDAFNAVGHVTNPKGKRHKKYGK